MSPSGLWPLRVQECVEGANVVGKSSKSKAGAVADTVVSASPPRYGAQELSTALDASGSPALGARTGQRSIAAPETRAECLEREEVVRYLRRTEPRELRAQVEEHIAGCSACARWVRHIGDDVFEYVGGQLPEDALAQMDAHLDACSACRDAVHHVVQGMAQSSHGEGHDVADSSTTFLPGNVVNGRYLVSRFVGRGGMGEVYEAFDQLMDRRIALKTVLCTVADRRRASRRFKEEVRNAQRVGHRHVCRINDLQEHREAMFGPPVPFFTMEYIDGERLGHRLTQGRLPLEDVRVIALQLLGGLDAAHTRGVLHLDFKSDNVMLRRETGTPDAVIMDFGLSRVLGKESGLRTSDRRQFAGTLPYMSVEQLECRDALGPATDVYAFGVVLYEMLTQSLPFDGESLGAMLLQQLEQRAKPPSQHVREIAPALDQFVLKCLHHTASQRFADAGEALAALQAIRSWSRPPLLTRLQQSLPWVAGTIGIGIVALSSIPRAERDPTAETPTHPVLSTQALEPAPPPPALDAAPRPLVPPALAAAVAPPPSEALSSSTPPLPAPSLAAIDARVAAPVSRAPRPRPSEAVASTPASEAAPPARAASRIGGIDGAPSVSDSPASTPLTPDAPPESWKPARVPKRLSVPGAASTGPSRDPR